MGRTASRTPGTTSFGDSSAPFTFSNAGARFTAPASTHERVVVTCSRTPPAQDLSE
jgi:hypothetical protein